MLCVKTLISDHELILYEIYVTALQSLVDEGIWCRGLEEVSIIFGEWIWKDQ